MARVFQIISKALVVIAIASVAAAVWKPLSYSSLLNIGLAFLIMAFSSSLASHYLLRSPIHARWSGALVTIDSNPISYRLWYLLQFLFSGFLLYVLLHSLP